MIGVRSKPLPPALLENTPGGIIHHLIGCAACADHFTDGLLGEDGHDAVLPGMAWLHILSIGNSWGSFAYRTDVPGGSQPQPISTAGRCADAQHAGTGKGQ